MESHFNTVQKLYKIQFGFKNDCEKLLKKYAEYKTHDYGRFCEIWKEMNFSLVYAGVKNSEEIVRQTELFLCEAQKYFLYAPSIYIKTASLYLLYGLYHKQPLQKTVKIRLIKDEFQTLNNYINDIKMLEEYDIMFIYGVLVHEDAFDYVYTQTPLAPDLVLFENLYTMTNDIFKDNIVDKIETNVKNLIENKDISGISEEYQKCLKEYLNCENKENFMSFDTDVQMDLKRIFIGEKIDLDENSEKVDDLGEHRIKLKKKAAGKK